MVTILCCASSVAIFAICYGWNFGNCGNFSPNRWEIVKDLRKDDAVESSEEDKEKQRYEKRMLGYICLVLAFLVLGAVGLGIFGYSNPLLFVPCGIALSTVLITLLTYTSWNHLRWKMLVFLIFISLPILILLAIIIFVGFGLYWQLYCGIALSLILIIALTYTSWKLKQVKMILPISLALLVVIWGSYPLTRIDYGDVPVTVVILLSMAVFVAFCCWTVVNHIRYVKPESIEEKNEDCLDSNGEDEEAQLREVNASTRSSICRESLVHIIPEACLVEIEDNGERRSVIAEIAEPMSLRWEQIRGKAIRSSVCLICLLFALGILVGGYFMLANTYPLNQKNVPLPGWCCIDDITYDDDIHQSYQSYLDQRDPNLLGDDKKSFYQYYLDQTENP